MMPILVHDIYQMTAVSIQVEYVTTPLTGMAWCWLQYICNQWYNIHCQNVHPEIHDDLADSNIAWDRILCFDLKVSTSSQFSLLSDTPTENPNHGELSTTDACPYNGELPENSIRFKLLLVLKWIFSLSKTNSVISLSHRHNSTEPGITLTT